MDLARAKSEALFNTYSLLKQSIKSCNARWRRQQLDTDPSPARPVGIACMFCFANTGHVIIL